MLHILYLIGIAAFAAGGVLAAHRARLDLFGGLVLALVCAVSGGTLRSLILGTGPVAWTHDPVVLTVIATTAAGTIAWMRHKPVPRHLLEVVDAIGLGTVTVIGARAAIDAHATPIAVLICATLTGITGEILRDLLCGRRPPLLLREQLYATCALAGAAVYLLLDRLGADSGLTALLAVLLTVFLRLNAIWFDLHLPRLRHHHSSRRAPARTVSNAPRYQPKTAEAALENPRSSA